MATTPDPSSRLDPATAVREIYRWNVNDRFAPNLPLLETGALDTSPFCTINYAAILH
jgi:hypothetical protein